MRNWRISAQIQPLEIDIGVDIVVCMVC